MKNLLIVVLFLLTSCNYNHNYEVKVWRGGIGQIQHYSVNLSPDQMLAQFQDTNFDSVKITGAIDTTITIND